MNTVKEEYTALRKYSTEDQAKTDLDTCGYSGKWKKAKEGVTREQSKLTGPAYWDAVRLYFLELGGCWTSQAPTKGGTSPKPLSSLEQRMMVQSAAIQASRQVGMTGFQKVRQG